MTWFGLRGSLFMSCTACVGLQSQVCSQSVTFPWKQAKIPKVGTLYDIETDPGETTNLAGKFPKRTAKMRTMLKNLRANPDPP